MKEKSVLEQADAMRSSKSPLKTKKKPHHRVVMILSSATITEQIEIFYNSGYYGFDGMMQAQLKNSLQPRCAKHFGQVYTY